MTVPFAPATRVLERAASNSHYRRAVEAVPGYRDAVELRLKAFRTRGSLPVTDYPPTPTNDDLDSWLDSIAQADTLERARAAKHEAISALIVECERTIQGAATLPDRLLESLSADMDALMNDVAEAVGRLDGARTAHDVLMKGGSAADVWRAELPSLRASYDDIRQAQDWVLAGEERDIHSRSKYLDDVLARDTAIANLDVIFPKWRSPAAGIQTLMVGQEPDPRPWPTDPIEQLIWLSTSGARVWVPTTKQLDELNTKRRRSRSGGKPEPTPDTDMEEANA